MTDHETIAAELIAASPAPTLKLEQCIARQGDVMLVREGNHDADADYTETPHGGILLSAGKHGEHRLAGDAVAWIEPGVLCLADAAVVVHTDVPTDRHGPIALSPGRWRYYALRELGAGDVVQEVKD